METTSMDQSDWPERFVYVCNATRAAVVNLAPLYHAGFDRVDSMVILCGSQRVMRQYAVPKSEAEDPAERLKTFATVRLGLSEQKVKIIYGNPESHLSWQSFIANALSYALGSGCDLVYNTTGGRKAMTLGALLGADIREPRLRIISVSGNPLRSVEVVRDGNGIPIDERALPVAGRMPLVDYASAYGYQEHERARRERKQKTLSDLGSISSRLLQEITALASAGNDGARQIIGQIHMQAHNHEKERRPIKRFECPLDLNSQSLRHAWASLSSALAGHPEVESSQSGRLVATSRDALPWLQGDWLESAVYYQVRGLLQVKGARYEAIPGLTLRVKVPGGRQNVQERADLEADLVLSIHDQVHVIEAKAITTTRVEGLNNAISKLARLRSTLVGQFGRIWLVAPLLSDRDIADGDYAVRAAHYGIRLLSGPHAVDELLRDLTELVKDEEQGSDV